MRSAGPLNSSRVSGIVRLHPSEDLASYESMIARHPTVSFVENRRASLDEALAASDIVVVRASGFGSDALVKRRPVVVLSPDQTPTGYDLDLTELAGCPHAHDSDELAAVLGRMARDPAFRAEREIDAEHFVTQFCAAFGNESADITVAAVRAMADRRGFSSHPTSTTRAQRPRGQEPKARWRARGRRDGDPAGGLPVLATPGHCTTMRKSSIQPGLRSWWKGESG